MSILVKPFAALRPRPEHAADVVAPPYDVVDTEEARALAVDRPLSFLHISRPEIDLPAGTDAHADAVYDRGAANLERLRRDDVLVREQAPAFYIYRMIMGTHTQTGVACAASVRAYDANVIRKHELTRPDKEDDRVRNMESLNAQTGPVLCAYRGNDALRQLLRDGTRDQPLFEVEGPNDVMHAVWRIDSPAAIEQISSALNALGNIYIADGHHRSAAASRVAQARCADSSDADASYEYFLTIMFPHDELQIFDYNRAIVDLNGLTPSQILERLAETFDVKPCEGRAKPQRAGTFGMYLDGRWYALALPGDAIPDDPVERLDVSLLQNLAIGPLLGIGDPRTDTRISFIGGVRGLEELEGLVDAGRAAVAFALYPTSMEQLMAVADAERLMPPKSTWFEPKLADGLLSQVLD